MAYQPTALGISVLALLRVRPMHGYEMLQRLVERDAGRIVKLRPGSLYHVLDRLADEKLICRAARGREGNRPERIVYEITDAGAEALVDRVRELVGAPANEYPQFVVALAEIHNLDPGTALEAVESRIAGLEAGVAEMLTLRHTAVAHALNGFVLDYLLATTQAQITWLQGFADSLRSGALQ